MLRSTRAFRFGAALALLAVALPSALACSSADPKTKPGDAAQVQIAAAFDMSEHRGKVVLLNFWATWCGPCRLEIPALVELRRSFGDDVSIVGISVNEYGSRDQVVARLQGFVAQYGINYPVFYDEKMALVNQFYGAPRLPAVPSTLILDQQGKVRRTHWGLPMNAANRPDPLSVFGEEIQKLLDES